MKCMPVLQSSSVNREAHFFLRTSLLFSVDMDQHRHSQQLLRCTCAALISLLALIHSLACDSRSARQFNLQKRCQMFLLIFRGKCTHGSLLVCAFGDIFALMFKLGKTQYFEFWCLSYPNSFTPVLLDFMLTENPFNNNGENFRLCDVREKPGNTTSVSHGSETKKEKPQYLLLV